MPRPGILVDIDGTLADTNYLHTLSWKRAFVECGYPDVATADIHRSVGMGGDQLVPHLIGREAPEVDAARKPYWQALRSEARGFPGAAALLADLHERGLAVVLATSADPEDVEALLGVVGADPSTIDHVTSKGDVEATKPSPDVFAVAMAQGGLDPARSIALGDTVWDVQAATRAGVPCMGVASGGISQADLGAAGAVATYRDVAHLRTELDRSPVSFLLHAM
jgi:HAD superfamily hydrolase (TIGR01509 family)